MNHTDLYQTVTDTIIAQLEQGTVPWVKPWSSKGHTSGLPFNVVSNRPYSGINVLLLWGATFSKGYASQGWLTYKQATNLGGSVKKGEKATHVVYMSKFLPKDQKRLPPDQQRFGFMLKSYYVFNTEQCECLPPFDSVEILPEPERNANADLVISQTGATIVHIGNVACYVPALDSIKMPAPAAFKDMDSYYSTTFHELGHWTGAKHRLERDQSGSFGSQAYAKEELVAEMTSAFLCAGLQLQPSCRHVDYIANWLKALHDDKKLIFTAASAASKAAQYILNPVTDESETDTEEMAA